MKHRPCEIRKQRIYKAFKIFYSYFNRFLLKLYLRDNLLLKNRK